MAKPIILICEDEIHAQDAIGNFLAKRNYSVYRANDGLKAIQSVKELNPDLVLLDVRMPKIDGIEVAKRIRAFNQRVKIVFLTAFEGQELSKEAAKYKISGYIVKPSPVENILKTIENALAD